MQLCKVNQYNALLKLISILLDFYMFRTSYVHLQVDHIVHAALCDVFSLHLCKQSTRLYNVLDKYKHKYYIQHSKHYILHFLEKF